MQPPDNPDALTKNRILPFLAEQCTINYRDQTPAVGQCADLVDDQRVDLLEVFEWILNDGATMSTNFERVEKSSRRSLRMGESTEKTALQARHERKLSSIPSNVAAASSANSILRPQIRSHFRIAPRLS